MGACMNCEVLKEEAEEVKGYAELTGTEAVNEDHDNEDYAYAAKEISIMSPQIRLEENYDFPRERGLQDLPVESLTLIASYLPALEFSRLRRVFQHSVKINKKEMRQRAVHLVNPGREDAFRSAMEFLDKKEHSEEVEGIPDQLQGFLLLTQNIDFWWAEDRKGVLQIFDALKDFSCWTSRQPDEAKARHRLLLFCASYCLTSETKSLRHFFAKQVKHLLYRGSTEDKLNVCSMLSTLRFGLGRFEEPFVRALIQLATDEKLNCQVHAACLRSLQTVIPANGAAKYPSILPILKLYHFDATPPIEVDEELITLMEQLGHRKIRELNMLEKVLLPFIESWEKVERMQAWVRLWETEFFGDVRFELVFE